MKSEFQYHGNLFQDNLYISLMKLIHITSTKDMDCYVLIDSGSMIIPIRQTDIKVKVLVGYSQSISHDILFVSNVLNNTIHILGDSHMKIFNARTYSRGDPVFKLPVKPIIQGLTQSSSPKRCVPFRAFPNHGELHMSLGTRKKRRCRVYASENSQTVHYSSGSAHLHMSCH